MVVLSRPTTREREADAFIKVASPAKSIRRTVISISCLIGMHGRSILMTCMGSCQVTAKQDSQAKGIVESCDMKGCTFDTVPKQDHRHT